MDIFVLDIPIYATDREVSKFFKPSLANCGIDLFHVKKHKQKRSAIITVLSVDAGQKFLDRHGARQYVNHGRAIVQLSWAGSNVRCSKARDPPNKLLLRTLQHDQSKQRVTKTTIKAEANQDTRYFRCNTTSLSCGMLEYQARDPKAASVSPNSDVSDDSHRLVFVPHFQDHRNGVATVGKRQLIVVLDGSGHTDRTRLDVSFEICQDIILDSSAASTLTLSLRIAPKILSLPSHEADLLTQFAALLSKTQQRPAKRTRMSSIDDDHSEVVGTCLVYQLQLANAQDAAKVRRFLYDTYASSATQIATLPVRVPGAPLADNFTRLSHELSDTLRFGKYPFALLFQAERLSKDGVLSPNMVRSLLPKFAELYESFGLEHTIRVLRRFHSEVPFPGPSVPAQELSIAGLASLLDEIAHAADLSCADLTYELVRRHRHIVNVHKAIVTPTGLRLSGPFLECTNRVMRRYDQHTDHFIRVNFTDEDGGRLQFDARTDNSAIYSKRFKHVLKNGVRIAGMIFTFLGFSHSSLRGQSCWFMSPFVTNSCLTYAQHVIKDLGDFSHIRTPAKCAARIGQNFTDTNATVEVQEQQVKHIGDVERNGRTFSDGVGTISSQLLKAVHRNYGQRRALKPSVLQIRFQGAKGMVSLDARLSGMQLNLRASMMKFEAKDTHMLEICGAGFKPLPMFLNRPLIKILEDLGIMTEVFLDLQSSAVQALRTTTTESSSTADMLSHTEVPKATKLSNLICYLGFVGLDYHADGFLLRVVEMAVIQKLHDIKYKARILIEDAVTLYGIMDETGELQEGEIFVITEKPPEDGRHILVQDQVAITRSPALHPGDVQVVKAVNVNEGSPLHRLRNTVVFSQHGQRDLPNQLSGGDLDGDYYNVIWDRRLIPGMIATPAEYPRVQPIELDRAVTISDMSDFFLKFMESDQVGTISTLHLALADQEELGVFHPGCIKLSQLA